MGKVSQQPHSKVNHYLFASQVLDSEALGNPMVMEEAKVAISEEEEEKPKVGICSPKVVTLPFPLRLRGKERFWLKNAHKQVQQWVLEGIKAPWEPETGPQMAISLQEKTAAETQAALDLLTEYVEVGAVSMATCPPDCNFKTFLEKRKVQYLVPWFIISKPEGDSLKHRLIADCKQLNKFFHCPHFKMEHWGKIFPLLRKGMYAAKIDLKHAYFHLPVHQSLKPYLHLKVGNHLFQFLAAPFGLSPLPFIWTQVMKTFSRVWRKKAIFCFIYLDDILVLAFSKQKLQKDLSFVLKTLEESGLTVNRKKSILEPVQTVEHLGFSLDLKKGILSVPSKNDNSHCGVEENLETQGEHTEENGFHFRVSKKFFDGVAPVEMFYRQNVKFCAASKQHKSLGFLVCNTRKLEERNRQFNFPITRMEREKFGGQGASEIFTFRQFRLPVGWSRSKHQRCSARILEGPGRSAHYSKRAVCSSADRNVTSQTQRSSTIGCGQSGSLLLSPQRGGRIFHLNALMRQFWTWCLRHHIQVLVHLVKSEEDQADPYTRMGLDSGDYTLNGHLFQRLLGHFQSILTQEDVWDMFASPGNKKFQKFCSRTHHWEASLVDALTCPLTGVNWCYANPPWTLINQWLIRLKKHPHITCMLVVPYWDSALWWPLLVKLHVPKTPILVIKPFPGMFSNCLGEQMPPPKVAPPLHFVIRKILEGRQMSAEAIDLYLKSLGDIRRYQNAFNMFWHQCSLLKDSLTIKCLTLDFVAERLLYLNAVSCSQARSAYAALLMIPGLEQLKFSPLLRKLKQSWNTSQPKYPIFWDMGSVLKKLASSPLDFSDVKQVRDRLILCWRLLGLYRSVDLAQVYRQVSWAGEKPFVLVKRKGWRAPRWEQAMVFEDVHLSPWHLLCQYVKLTCHLPKGSLLLRSLLAPFSPIGSDRVASLTRKMLQDLGVPMYFWGPHSTRGAGVQFFKKLGLTSEQVCEMGPWKNLGAFSTHYLRLGAQEAAGKEVQSWVHRVSKGSEAEPERSQTPPREAERGGSDLEGEAKEHFETCFGVPAVLFMFFGSLSSSRS